MPRRRIELEIISLHRVAAALHRRGVPVVPALIDRLIFLLFNSAIDRRTQIGAGTRSTYRGMSVVIHRDAIIGADVSIGAHVVVGGRSGQRPPRIGDRVLLGANAMVLGDVTVGDDAIVGAGAVVLRDVPAGATAVGNPARIVSRGE